MIECKHQWPFFVTNRGFNTWWCELKQKSVNEHICSECSDREGELRKEPVEFPEIPQREPEEVKAIYTICRQCPHLCPARKVCNKMHPEIHPPDIIAQHPAHHCPEGQW